MFKLKHRPVRPATVNASPLKRRNFLGGRGSSSRSSYADLAAIGNSYGMAPIPVAGHNNVQPMTLKGKRIISQYAEVLTIFAAVLAFDHCFFFLLPDGE